MTRIWYKSSSKQHPMSLAVQAVRWGLPVGCWVHSNLPCLCTEVVDLHDDLALLAWKLCVMADSGLSWTWVALSFMPRLATSQAPFGPFWPSSVLVNLVLPRVFLSCTAAHALPSCSKNLSSGECDTGIANHWHWPHTAEQWFKLQQAGGANLLTTQL